MLNFGIVGCGRIAARHSELLGAGKITGARLAAVCDIKSTKAQKLGIKYTVPYYSDMDVMMKTEKITYGECT